MQNTFPVFTNSFTLCGTIWSTLARRVALYNQHTITQSIFFLKTLKPRWTAHPQHELQTTTCLWRDDCTYFFFFFKYCNRSPQMPAQNRALFRESFHATQTPVQLVYVIVHSRIYRHKLRSGTGHAASWKRPSLAWALASKC